MAEFVYSRAIGYALLCINKTCSIILRHSGQEEFVVLQTKAVRIGFRSRLRVTLMRLISRPLLSLLMGRVSKQGMSALQFRAAGIEPERCGDLPVGYRIINNVPGTVVGDLNEKEKPIILYLHGGGFMFPASPDLQLKLLGRICKDLDAVAFMPSYRLSPQHSAPCALDDCESAYRGLLDLGYAAEQTVVIGESAGGNLVLGLLQRLRKHGLPMPACAVPISPVTELARAHALPSRRINASRDALVSPANLYRINEWYVGDEDACDPELSPLYADYRGFPPLFFLVSDQEMLRDDGVLAAQKAREAGVETQIDIWPVLPHAFLIFEDKFSEASQARADVVRYIQGHLARRPLASASRPTKAA